MLKHHHTVMIGIPLLLIVALIWVAQVRGVSLQWPARLWARIPISVGNRPAPIPILDVQNVHFSSAKDVSKAQVQRSISSFLGRRGVTAAYALKEYQVTWQVSVEDGSLSNVHADVFVPVGKADQQFPVIVYGAGSTGLDDRCAPSREDLKIGNMGNYRNQMITQASQGYIVMLPNYEGFDNPYRTQNYFNKDNEARSLLSAAKAITDEGQQINLPMQPGALFIGGYSQGGHATFSAADYAASYTPFLKIAGVFGHGPTTDLYELLQRNPNLAAYFAAAYHEYYPDFDVAEILEPAWQQLLTKAETLCVNEGFGTNSTTVQAVFQDPFEDFLATRGENRSFSKIKAILDENNAGTFYTYIPTFIAQGTTDPIVTLAAQQHFVDDLCQRGVPVQMMLYPGVHHFQTRQDSFRDTNNWINAIARGEAPKTSCPPAQN